MLLNETSQGKPHTLVPFPTFLANSIELFLPLQLYLSPVFQDSIPYIIYKSR
jgi:hypothetical protein